MMDEQKPTEAAAAVVVELDYAREVRVDWRSVRADPCFEPADAGAWMT